MLRKRNISVIIYLYFRKTRRLLPDGERIWRNNEKAGVCGHFGFGCSLLNGQTVKTKNVTDELQKYFGDAQVAVADSCGGIKAMPRMAIDVLKLFKGCENIIMMPANRGLRVFAPLFLFYNKLYHRKIHYVVIGGWLDSFLDEHKRLVRLLKNLMLYMWNRI